MKISEAGIDLIKRFEGLELESYQDIAGVWTIGYGHTETAGPNQRINEREAEELLRRDLGPRERAVDQLVGVQLNQNEFDALVSFIYNVGANAFKTSTARKRLNRNDRIGAAEALTWWNKATVNGVLREVLGLTRRRASERALFLTPVNPPLVNNPENISENSRVTPTEESPRRENIGESRTIQGATVAGGAGAMASTIGRDSAEELDQIETNIEQGTSLTETPAAESGAAQSETPTGETQTGETQTGETQTGETQTGDAQTGDAQAGDAPGADGAAVDGEPPAGETTDGGADDAGAGDAAAAAEGGSPVAEAAPGGADDAPAAGEDMIQTIELGPERPSKHEKHAVDAQLQFALLIIILLSAAYIVIARIDDWWRYRR